MVIFAILRFLNGLYISVEFIVPFSWKNEEVFAWFLCALGATGALDSL